MAVHSYCEEELPASTLPQLATRLLRCSLHVLYAADGQEQEHLLTVMGEHLSRCLYGSRIRQLPLHYHYSAFSPQVLLGVLFSVMIHVRPQEPLSVMLSITIHVRPKNNLV